MGHPMFDSRTKACSLAFLLAAGAVAGLLTVVLSVGAPVADGSVTTIRLRRRLRVIA